MVIRRISLAYSGSTAAISRRRVSLVPTTLRQSCVRGFDRTAIASLLTTFALFVFGLQNVRAEVLTPQTPCDQIRRFAEARLDTDPVKPPATLRLHFPCLLPHPTKNLQFVIATAPNPIETHLALWFDRELESIQGAADSVGLRFQSAWIPWEPDLARAEPDLEKRQQQEQEKKSAEAQPGVLLFRTDSRNSQGWHQPEDLVVLVVPETPTGGIDTNVFCDAVRIIAGSSSQAKIPVLGPSFSGSFASLAKILDKNTNCAGDSETNFPSNLIAISGSSTSPSAWKDAFQRNNGDYHTTVHNTDVLLRMLRSEQFPNARLAILRESETAILRDPETTNATEKKTEARSKQDPIQYLVYPREISRLRNAYSDEELKAVVGPQQQPSFRNLLTFRLSDNAPVTDTIPVFAKNQTPLSQDAVLEAIARTLQEQQISMAGLLATDPFDALFIARYLRDACPNIRLFTLDSDLLWVRGAEDFPFTGTLAVTTYPLSEGTRQPEHTPFPSRASEGIYNATRSLLLQLRGTADTSSPPDSAVNSALTQYQNPFNSCQTGKNENGCETPPVWLTVVSRSGYWPIAVRQPTSPQPNLLSWGHPLLGDPLSAGALPHLWRFGFAIVTVLLSWCFYRVVAPLTRLGRRWSFAEFGVWQEEPGWPARLCYLVICCVALLGLYGVYVAPMLSLYQTNPNNFFKSYAVAAFVFSVLFTAGAAAPVIKAACSRRTSQSKFDRWHYGILAIAGVYTAVLAWSLEQLFAQTQTRLQNLQNHEMFFFAYRAIHLSSAVSPIAPLLFFLAGLFLWARTHLRRVALLHDRTSWLPALGSGPSTKALHQTRLQLERVVRDPLPWGWRTLGAFALSAAIWYFLARPLRSFEYAPYDSLILISSAVLFGLLFLTWARIMLIWQWLALFLEGLERHCIRFAFSALPRWETWSPIFRSTPGRRSYSTDISVRDLLNALRKNSADASERIGLNIAREDYWPPVSEAAKKYFQQLETVLALAACGIRVPRKEHWKLCYRLARVDRLLISRLQRDHWSTGDRDQQIAATEQPDQKGSADLPADCGTAQKTADASLLAEKIIALQVIGYLQHALQQIRNLIFFVAAGFVLAAVALNSYPFQAPRTIATFMTIMFVLFAGGIAYVMVQAARNPTLSRITNTSPKVLNLEFFQRFVAYLGLPLVTVASWLVPSLGRFLFSWVEPALQALK